MKIAILKVLTKVQEFLLTEIHTYKDARTARPRYDRLPSSDRVLTWSVTEFLYICVTRLHFYIYYRVDLAQLIAISPHCGMVRAAAHRHKCMVYHAYATNPYRRHIANAEEIAFFDKFRKYKLTKELKSV